MSCAILTQVLVCVFHAVAAIPFSDLAALEASLTAPCPEPDGYYCEVDFNRGTCCNQICYQGVRDCSRLESSLTFAPRSTTAEPTASTTYMPSSSTTAEPTASTTYMPSSSTTDEPTASTADLPSSSTSDLPSSSTTDEP